MMSVGSAKLRLTSGLLARWRYYRQRFQQRRALIEIVQRKDDYLLRDAGLSEADVRESLRVLPFLKSLSGADAAVRGRESMPNRVASSPAPSASIVWLHTADIAEKGGSPHRAANNCSRVAASVTVLRSIQGPRGLS